MQLYEQKRVLAASELEAMAGALLGRPQLWAHLVRHEPEQRVYEQLWLDEHVGAWLLCWMDDHDTGFTTTTCPPAGWWSRGERCASNGWRWARSRSRVCSRLGDLLVRVVGHPSRRAPGQRARRHAARVLTAAGQDGGLHRREKRVLARHSVSYTEELKPLAPEAARTA